MARRLVLMLAALCVIGFVLAGCGDDDDDSGGGGSGSSDPPAATEKKSDDPRIAQAVEQCKEQADASSRLSPEAREKIVEVCDKAASGDAEAALEAVNEPCIIVVEDTVPEGDPAREDALGNCDLVGAAQ